MYSRDHVGLIIPLLEQSRTRFVFQATPLRCQSGAMMIMTHGVDDGPRAKVEPLGSCIFLARDFKAPQRVSREIRSWLGPAGSPLCPELLQVGN